MDDAIGLPGDRPHERWMRLALDEARAAAAEDEVPVGAIVVAGGRVIASAHNQREQLADPTAHAEMIALTQAAAALGSWRLEQCTLYVTLEPCPMCAGALVQARMGRVLFGVADPKRGGLGGVLDLSRCSSAHHHMHVQGGLLAEPCSTQLEGWFRQRRQQKREQRCGTPGAPAPAG